MPNAIDSPEYWIEDFEPTSAELDALYARALETTRPTSVEDLAAALIMARADRALAARRAASKGDGIVYVPSNRYEKGQKLVFPALDGATGKVKTVRPGTNPEYGAYEVIGVEIEKTAREFAAGITWDHSLMQAESAFDPDELAERYAPVIAPKLRERLTRDSEWKSFGEQWILKALLPEINAGHLNLSEAIIMLAGEPVTVNHILGELDLGESTPEETRALAVEAALEGDDRFRNVGAFESPLWALTSQN